MNIYDRITKLEYYITKLEHKNHMKSEAALLNNVLPLIVKNLPTILKLITQFSELLKTDQINDNSELVDKIDKFSKLGQEIITAISGFGKQ